MWTKAVIEIMNNEGLRHQLNHIPLVLITSREVDDYGDKAYWDEYAEEKRN